MTEHYTTNTESTTRHCNYCGRPTQHRVSDGRVGRCMEHPAPFESKKQRKEREARERAEKNPTLF